MLFHVQSERSSEYKNDDDKTFLADRPEIPTAAKRDSQGASGLEGWVEGAALATIGLGLGEELWQKRPRSVSASVPVAEKELDLSPKSRSRPSSPEPVLEHDRQFDPRSQSLVRSVGDSPTAVPLHFRRPPTSPSLHRVSPIEQQSVEAFDTPTQPRHRRPNSVEFVNSREIRPLWLVERHSSLAESQLVELLPSLPSSKTSSRVQSVEDLQAVRDEDAVRSWEPFDLTPSAIERRRSSALAISTERTNASDGDADLLDSQQATPTAEMFGTAPFGSAKKDKPKYEFHSPSELLRDSETYPELPPSPTIESLPSPVGSVIGVMDSQDNERAIDVQPDITTPTQENSSSSGIPALGFGFAGLVDAAVINAVKESSKQASSGDEKLTEITSSPRVEVIPSVPEPTAEHTHVPTFFPGFANVVNAAVVAETSSHDKPTTDEVKSEFSALAGEEPFEILDAESAEEGTKELILEPPTEPKTEEPQPKDEPVAEEVMTPFSSKSKKKKKGKKGKASQSVDLTPEPTASEEKTPVVESAEEPRSIEFENAADRGITASSEAEYIEASAELEPEVLSTQVYQSAEANLTGDSQLEVVREPESAPAVAAENEPVEAMTISVAQPESEIPSEIPAESEQLEPTENLSKKAKRDKKKQKKAKSISAVDDVADAQPSDTLSEDQSQRNENVSAPVQKPEESPVPAKPVDMETLQEGNVASDSVSADGALGFQDSLETIEAAAPVPTETISHSPAQDITPAYESTSLDAPVSVTREVNLSQPSAKVIEQSELSQDAVEPSEEVKEPVTVTKEADTISKTEAPEDVFQETVETQPAEADKTEEPTLPPSGETGSPSGEYSDTYETQPEYGSRQVTDVLEPAFEEIAPTIAPTDESLLALSGDVEPISSTEPVEPPAEIPDQATSKVEPEVEIPLTAAQKKKAKKDKKRKSKQESAPSISADKSIDPQLAESQLPEAQPIENIEPVVTPAVEILPDEAVQTVPDTENLMTDVAPFEQTKELDIETEQAKEVEPILTPTVTEAVSDLPINSDDTEHKEEEPSTQDDMISQAQPELEETQAVEPDAPMTAAQKKKAKKLKKKQEQQQQEQEKSTGSADEVRATETSLTPEPEVLEPVKDIQPSLETENIMAEDTPVLLADLDIVDSTAVQNARDANTLAVETSTEPSTDVPFSSEDITPSANLSEQEKNDAIESEKPEEVNADPVATDEPEVPTEVIKLPEEGPVPVPAEPEVPMTAAQKKKAKKDKKKQEKQQTMQSLEQPTFVDSLEQQDARQAEGKLVGSQPITAVDLPPDSAADSMIEKAVPAEIPPSEANIDPEVEAESKEIDGNIQDTPVIDEVSAMDPVDKDFLSTLESDLPTETIEASLPQEIPSDSPLADTAPMSEIYQDSKEESAPAETRRGLEKADDEPTVAADMPLDTATPGEPVSAEVEQLAEFEPAPAMSKKERKKQKKRQSLGLEESQPESQSEPVKEAPIGPSSPDNSEAPASTEISETTAFVEAPQISDEPVQEESPKEEPTADLPSSGATEDDSQFVSKKKAKKDKKKRKSVSWDVGETPLTQNDDDHPEQEASESVKDVGSRDAAAIGVIPTEELTETPLGVKEYVPAVKENDAIEPQISVVDATKSAEDVFLDNTKTAEAFPDEDALQSASNVETTEPEAPVDKELEKPEPEVSIPAPSEEIVPAAEESSFQGAEPVEENTEENTDAGLSAKERRKLKKKEKRKSKSVEEISEPSNPMEEFQKPDSSAQSPVDISEAQDTQITQLPETTDAAIEQELSKAKDAVAEESTEKSVEIVQSDSNEPNETVQPTDSTTPSNEIDQIAVQDHTDVQDLDTSSTTAEPILSPEGGGEETEQPAEPEADTALSAKERRKAKKNKKRQSKNLDLDLAHTTESDSAITEAVAQEAEKTIVTETNTTDLPESVTAPLLAKEDGKEYLTHDIETPDVQANDLASTDEFVSSQVEQPQSESRSMDSHVLDRNLEFSQSNEQKEEDVASAALEAKELTATEKEVGMEEDLKYDVENAVDDVLEGTAKEGTKTEDVIDKELQSDLKDEVSTEEPASELPVDKIEDETAVGEELDVPAPELESLQLEDNDSPESLPQEADSTPVAESDQTAEPETVPVTEHPSVKQINEAEDAPTPQVVEQAELPEDIKPSEEAPTVSEVEQGEAPSLSRKLSKKERKKQQQREALLAKQAAAEAEAEAKIEKQPVSEAVELSTSIPEELDPAVLVSDQQENNQFKDQTETTVQVADEPNPDLPRDITEEELQIASGPNPAEPAIEPLTEISTTVEEIQASFSDTHPDTLPVETSLKQPDETLVKPENERPTVLRKMSKKEKKKAAAAAAAAAAVAAQEDKITEPSAPVDEPSVLIDEPSVPIDEQSVPIDEPSAPVDEPSVPIDEPYVPVDEPSVPVDEPSVPVDEPSVPVDEPSVPVDEPSVPVDEPSVPVDEPSVPVDEPSVPVDEPSVPVDEPSVPVDEPSVPVDEQSVPVDEQSVPVDEQYVPVDEQSVPVDEQSVPVDALADSSNEQTQPELQAEHNTRDLVEEPLPAVSAASENVSEKPVESSPTPGSFDHEATPEEVTEKPTSTPAVSRKLSKKEKRKAKKQAEEEPVDLPKEIPEKDVKLPETKQLDPTAVAVTDMDMAQELVPKSELAVHDTPADSIFEHEAGNIEVYPTVENEKEFELEREANPFSDAQPDHEPKSIEDPLLVIPELATEYTEPEPTLSRKASKKKAKKAKEVQQPLDNEIGQSESAIPLEKGVPTDRDFDLALQDSKPDEEFPTIDWDPRKSGNSRNSAELQDQIPEAEPVPIPATEAIDEFDESAIPSALQQEGQKKAKKNKRKSEQIGLVESDETLQEPSHKKVELDSDMQSKLPMEIESIPPMRSTTPGGPNIANLFPDLERRGFRRSTLEQQTPSLKDSAEEETVADLEANREIAIPVSEAPLVTTESREITETSHELVEATDDVLPEVAQQHDPLEDLFTYTEESHEPEPELPKPRDHLQRFSSPPPKSSSKERSSILFSSSPSTRNEEQSSPVPPLPSQLESGKNTAIGLHRTPSIIHGQHQHTPRTWNLEESAIAAVRTPSPPRSIFGPFDDATRPRTPLDPIAEQETAGINKDIMAHYGSPRLEIKPEHVLPRPQTPVRKFTDNSMASEAWPTPDIDETHSTRSPSKTPEHGMPVLKPAGSKGKLRRANRRTSSDMRAASRVSDSQPPPLLDLDQLPSSSSYDPVTDKGKRALRNIRPPSVRRRQSVQHLQDLETRLDQLISENRLLVAARDEAEERMRKNSVARRRSDQALNISDHDLRDKEAEVEQLKSSVDWLQREMGRLTQENEGLTASNAALAAAHASEVTHVRESSTRELDDLRLQHGELSTKIEERVRQEIESALTLKDAELQRLRVELEQARDKVKELQQQISASVNDNALVFRDEDYFDAACQKLCGHVQQWVLRFSKHSDHRRCRLLSELRDEKIADRFENALLDGSDADSYLSDRVRRRDVFMSVVMTMVWEYIFTRYLFGMDREQRQKLKSLEKHLGEVGARRAVQRWRATTLTLLSRRPAFASQRQSDTEAVTLEIFGTLSRILPPPSAVEAQLLESLRKVMRVAVILSLEMRTQMAEYIMLPPLQPEYDTNGDLARQVFFNASLMNERSGETNSNDELQTQQAVVRIVLFPLVVKKGNDFGEGEEEVVVCPAQVLIARPSKDKRLSHMTGGDDMSLDASKSVHSLAPSIAPSIAPSSSMMDMSNMI
ncbi:hypothetical protein N7495_008783 [Penicillium taxi]|uniref:uncharacterized protein n=1 Tax=Penicillium taxi TaxID=168475 RepID=UPI002545AF61|nr:uncharacterized protein N7495_008783 [Penicillium taxi]KAJ5888742.1 hypothetical protein N7495_008783 [Penicillium taxi]